MSKTFLKTMRDFFLSPDATEQELEQKATEQMQARDREGETEASTEDASEGEADTTDQVDANATETVSEAATEASTPTLSAEEIGQIAAKAATDAVAAALAPLTARVEAIANADATDHTSGKQEAVQVADQQPKVWENNPVNQAAAKRFPTKK